jgi:hypothetical protein
MATERVTERSDGSTERTYVDRGGGSGVGGVIIGVAVLALVAIIAFFLLNQSRNDNMRTDAVTSAASTVADSTANAAKSVGDSAATAARNTGDTAAAVTNNAGEAADSATR